MAYNKNTDYQAKINEAVKNGDYDSAARYENERNEKIEKENLSYEKTNKYSAPKGVNGTTQNKIQSSFNPTQKVTTADNMVSQTLSNVIKTTSKDKLISDEVYELLGQSFEVPTAVTEADAYLKQQLEKIQSGKTSYTDQIKDMMDKIVNREKFSYDVDTDPLFQQALSSAMKSGNQAMQDTIGQASALTGGYGSTYATSVGNQVYNSYIEDAYDNLPQYYQMALEAYQMEGDEMYRQLGMFNDADDKEFNRTLSAYDTTSQYRNRLWDEAHTLFRDEKTDILSVANLQLAEHGQLSSDAFNAFTATSNYADTMYGREYAKWNDEVNQALQYAQMQNNDYWNDSNQKFQSSENEKQREWQSGENQIDRDWKTSEAEKDRNFTASENAKNRATKSSGGGGGANYKLSTTEISGLVDHYKNGGVDSALAYLAGVGKTPTDDYSLSIIENILGQEDIKAENDKIANTPKTGAVTGFRTKENDNFTVKVGLETYGVENHGKVTDSKTVESLNKLHTRNDTAFLYNGDVYVKSADSYYQIGAKGFGNNSLEKLKKALLK